MKNAAQKEEVEKRKMMSRMDNLSTMVKVVW